MIGNVSHIGTNRESEVEYNAFRIRHQGDNFILRREREEEIRNPEGKVTGRRIVYEKISFEDMRKLCEGYFSPPIEGWTRTDETCGYDLPVSDFDVDEPSLLTLPAFTHKLPLLSKLEEMTR